MEYYVIINLKNLKYANEGFFTDNIKEADSFKELKLVKEEITNYDEDIREDLAIYKITEKITRDKQRTD